MNLSPDSNLILTGAYNSNLHVLDIKKQTNTTIDVKYMEKRGKNVGFMRPYKGIEFKNNLFYRKESLGNDVDF